MRLLTFFFTISAFLFSQKASAQVYVNKSEKNIKPIEKFFSQVELKIFYGLSYRPMNTSTYDEINTHYYDVQSKGKEFSFEGTAQVYNNFFVSIYFSKFNTSTTPANLALAIDGNSFLVINNENIQITRKGMSVNYQKQLIKTSYARLNVSGGFVHTNYKNKIEFEGNNGKFNAKLINKPKLHPYFSIGISSAVLVPELQFHVRYTRHFGTYDKIEDKEIGIAYVYENFEVNSLKQNTIQTGLSWLFNFKNPLKVKAP